MRFRLLLVAGLLSAAMTVGLVAPSQAAARTPAWWSQCHPLEHPGSVETWFQDRTSITTLERQWRRLICSAGRGSTVSVAMMFVSPSGPAPWRLISALRWVHFHRGVRVRVIVQRSLSTAAGWRWVLHSLAFASVSACWRSCHSSSPGSHMHVKFTLVSRTIFGQPAVLESSANWSQEQLEGQRQDGVYVYGDTGVYAGFRREWQALVNRVPNEQAAWLPGGRWVSYSFDPHPVRDPVAEELGTLACKPGDVIDVANAVFRRRPVIEQLNRLRAAGCVVRGIAEHPERNRGPRFPVRRLMEHDRFAVVHAHTAVGGMPRDEVLAGSELCEGGSLRVSDNQVVRVRREDTYQAYRHWFWRLWREAAG